MKSFAVFAVAAAAAAILSLDAAPSLAQTRVFVSGQGSDTNPCSISLPCRSFQQAHNTVTAGGEIVALDDAGYGTLTITKAVTVSAVGVEASITSTAASPSGLVIIAGLNDEVIVHGLTLISGTGTGDGIDINSGKSVKIRNCTVSGFPGQGVSVEPSANLDVLLNGMAVDNNGNNGLFVSPSGSGTVTVYVNDSGFNGNAGSGVDVSTLDSTGKVTVTLSLSASANGADGVFVTSATGDARPVVMVTSARMVNNVSNGLTGSGNVEVFVDRAQISGNRNFGWTALSSASVSSYKDNEVNGNGTDGLNGVVQISEE